MNDNLLQLLNQAHGSLKRGDYNKAISIYREIFNQIPQKYLKTYEILQIHAVCYAVALAKLKFFDEAESVLKELRKIIKKKSFMELWILYGYATLYFEEFRYEDAIKEANKLIRSAVSVRLKKEVASDFREDILNAIRDARIIKAKSLFFLGNYEDAFKIFKELAEDCKRRKDFDKYISMQIWILRCYQRLGKWYEILEMSSSLLAEVKDKNVETKSVLISFKVNALIVLNKYNEAEKVIKEAIELSRRNKRALKQVGGILRYYYALLTFRKTKDITWLIKEIDEAINEEMEAIGASSFDEIPKKLVRGDILPTEVGRFLSFLTEKIKFLAICGKYDEAERVKSLIRVIVEGLKDQKFDVDYIISLSISKPEFEIDKKIKEVSARVISQIEKSEMAKRIGKLLEKKYGEKKVSILQSISFDIYKVKQEFKKLKKDPQALRKYKERLSNELRERIGVDIEPFNLWEYLSEFQDVFFSEMRKSFEFARDLL